MVYTRSIVIDGNFAADHLKMRHPENDVALSPGGQYMVEPTRYKAHLESAVDHREVSDLCDHLLSLTPDYVQRSTCSDHKVVNRVSLTQASSAHWNWSSCMCSAWVFLSTICG